MPGTIQVSVIDFKSVSSSSQSSAKSIKVSMGKTHYHTYDKGDFSFPLTKLREDLVVALLDAEGYEIAHADIRTMQIVEKGYWDEVFSLDEGGGSGHVHMKLRFVLSEEDRKRVRVMRESAIKKKHETDPILNLRVLESTSSSSDSAVTSPYSVQVSDSKKRLVEIDAASPKIRASCISESTSATIDFAETSSYSVQVSDSRKTFVDIEVASPKIEALRADSSLDSASSSVASSYSYQKEEQSILSCAIPNATDTSQGASSSPCKHEVKTESCQENESIRDEKMVTESPFTNKRSDIAGGASAFLSGLSILNKTDSVTPKLRDDPIKLHNQGPSKKTPSSVRKMISAFESSPFQDFKNDTKSLKKSASVPSQLNRTGKVELLEVQGSKIAIQPAESLRKAKHHPVSETSATQRADIVSSNIELLQVPKELELSVETIPIEKASDAEDTSNVAPRKTILKENKRRSQVVFVKQSTLETASDSGRMDDELSPGVQSENLSAKSVNSSDSSDSERREETTSDSGGMDDEPCQRVQCDNSFASSVNYSDSSVTERRETDLKSFDEEKKISSESELLKKHEMQVTKYKMSKDEESFANLPESGSDCPPEDSSNGLVGLVIKIVVVLGFGVLVLLTRQKEPRKKSREEYVEGFTVSDYIEER